MSLNGLARYETWKRKVSPPTLHVTLEVTSNVTLRVLAERPFPGILHVVKYAILSVFFIIVFIRTKQFTCQLVAFYVNYSREM